MAFMPNSIIETALSGMMKLPLAAARERSLIELVLGRKPEVWENLALTIVSASIFLGVISGVAMFCIWWERKVAGHIQCRQIGRAHV